MKCITVDTVKERLGITVSTYDDALELAVNRIDTIVKRITKNRFNMQLVGTTVSGSADVIISEGYAYNGVQCFDTCGYIGMSLSDVVTNGQMIEGTGIPSGAYVSDVYSNGKVRLGDPVIVMNANATASGDVTIMTGIPVDLQTIIAQGAWWIVSSDQKIAKDESWTHRSMGPLSVSRTENDANKIDGASGMPMWFVRAFPSFQGGW